LCSRDVAGIVGDTSRAVRREPSCPRKAGLLKSHKEGNLKHPEVVKELPFHAELKEIVQATVS